MTPISDIRQRLLADLDRWSNELQGGREVRGTLGIGIGLHAVRAAEALIRTACEQLVGAERVSERATLGQLIELLRREGRRGMTCLGLPRGLVVTSEHSALAALTKVRNSLAHVDPLAVTAPMATEAVRAARAVAELQVFRELECREGRDTSSQ